MGHLADDREWEPHRVKRYQGIDVVAEDFSWEGGWGSGLRNENGGDTTMVNATDFDKLLTMYNASRIENVMMRTLIEQQLPEVKRMLATVQVQSDAASGAVVLPLAQSSGLMDS